MAKTPLMLAAQLNKPEVLKILMKYVANPFLMGMERKTALMFAQDKGDKETIELLEAYEIRWKQFKAQMNQFVQEQK